MAKYDLVYKKPAAKAISKLPPQIKDRLKLKLEWLVSQPDPLAYAKHLTKPADAEYRYRVGHYRVLFDVEDHKLIVLYVQHRRDVYRR